MKKDRITRKAETDQFIKDCEQSLIRLIKQEAAKINSTWPKVYNTFEAKATQLLNNPLYKERKGFILLATSNVRKALHERINNDKEEKKDGSRNC